MWAARAGGVIVGSDRYVGGQGAMDWKLLGLIRVMHADGSDLSRSAAGRAGAEGLWVPTALLPRFGVAWTATDPRHITASYRLDDTQLDVRYALGDDARVRSVIFDRWGDPNNGGSWAYHSFGFEATDYATFRRGYDPPPWPRRLVVRDRPVARGEFFRSEITNYHLVAQRSG